MGAYPRPEFARLRPSARSLLIRVLAGATSVAATVEVILTGWWWLDTGGAFIQGCGPAGEPGYALGRLLFWASPALAVAGLLVFAFADRKRGLFAMATGVIAFGALALIADQAVC